MGGKMRNYLLILGIISIFLISACSQKPEQSATQPKAIISEKNPAAEPQAQAKTPAEVPAQAVKEFDITAKAI